MAERRSVTIGSVRIRVDPSTVAGLTDAGLADRIAGQLPPATRNVVLLSELTALVRRVSR